MAKKPKAQPQQKGQGKSNTFRPILRQQKVEKLAVKYYEEFESFQAENPDAIPAINQPKFDRIYYFNNLRLTRKTSRPIWKK